jgi:photosystem II stability/assembly factor-like uncharacterized protein
LIVYLNLASNFKNLNIMTKPQLILSALAISAIGLTSAWVNSSLKNNPENLFLNSKLLAEEKKEKETSIKGAMEYYKKVRANEVTGTVQAEDIENAYKQAKILSSKKATRAFDNLSWESAGPSNVGGRTRAVISDKDSSNRLYMASVGGGLFISRDGGDTWTKRNGNDSAASPSAVTIAQGADGAIYYGTGEGNTGFADVSPNSHNLQIIQMGEGVFKSTDHGNSFTLLASTKPTNSNDGSVKWAFCDKVVASPTDANKIIACTNKGLQVSTTGGNTWNVPAPTGLGTSGSSRFCDVEISSDGNRVLAATRNAVYLSNDAGATFAKTGASTFSGVMSRIDVAIAPSNPNTMYVCIAGTSTGKGTGLTAIYKTIDAGANWTILLQGGSAITNPLGDQGDYDLAFGVHPLQDDMVFCGGQLNMWRYSNATGWKVISTNSSASSQVSSGLSIHSDLHAVSFNTANPETMYVVCDGGFYRTSNSRAVQPFFAEKNKNFTTAQCYGTAVNTLGKIIYGLQDNGSGIIGNSTNSSFESSDLTGGDGMRCAISDINPGHIITTSQEGNMQRAIDGGSNGGGSFTDFYDKNVDRSPETKPDGIPDENDGANWWLTPMLLKEKIINNKLKQNFVIGTAGSVWMTQTPFLGKSIWFKISKDVGRYSSFASSDDGKVLYAGTESGSVYRIDMPSLFDSTYRYFDTIKNEFGAQGYPYRSLISQTKIGTYGRFITDLSCTKDGETLVVTLGNYANTSYVHRSSNARTGTPVTFTDITGTGINGLPPAPVYTSILVNNNPNKIMVGTEVGVFGTDNGGASWVDLNFNTLTNQNTWHPRVATYELVEKPFIKNANGSEYHGSIIYSATHGRGVFRTFSMAKFWPTGVNEFTKDVNTIKVYPNPANDVAYFDYSSIGSSNLSVTIYSLTGTRVHTMNTKANNGDNKIEMNVSALAKGAYVVSINNGQQKFTSTLLKN